MSAYEQQQFMNQLVTIFVPAISKGMAIGAQILIPAAAMMFAVKTLFRGFR